MISWIINRHWIFWISILLIILFVLWLFFSGKEYLNICPIDITNLPPNICIFDKKDTSLGKVNNTNTTNNQNTQNKKQKLKYVPYDSVTNINTKENKNITLNNQNQTAKNTKIKPKNTKMEDWKAPISGRTNFRSKGEALCCRALEELYGTYFSFCFLFVLF